MLNILKKSVTAIYSVKNFALLQYCIEKSIGKQEKIHPFYTPRYLFKLPNSRLSAYEMNSLSNRSVQCSHFSFPQCTVPELLASWLEFQ